LDYRQRRVFSCSGKQVRRCRAYAISTHDFIMPLSSYDGKGCAVLLPTE
jgi:hypothetical protein